MAGRVRREEEEEEIRHVIEKHMKRSININHLFNQLPCIKKTSEVQNPQNNEALVIEDPKIPARTSKKDKRKAKKLKEKVGKLKLSETVENADSSHSPIPGFEHVVMTTSMKRMLVLTWQAIKFQEPVLLVGETGSV